MFDQIFLSSQVKRCMIISNKYGIHELPHKLPKDLGSQENKKYQENFKTSYNYSLVVSLPPKMKNFSLLAKNS